MAFDPNQHMMSLKGKDYLQVAWRLVWFREEHPDWSIDTMPLEYDDQHAIFKALICDESGVLKSSGHGSECRKDFTDFLEKAETKAVGRALAMLGYGTQFAADELDEGERIADTPIDRTPKPAQKPAQPAPQPAQKAQPKPANTGSAQLATPEQKKMLRDVINLEQLAACNKMYGEDWGTMTANQCAAMFNKIMRQQNGEAH
jgi:hypothetical protein